MAPPDDPFRAELRSWLAEHPPPAVERRGHDRTTPRRCGSGSARCTPAAGSASTGRSSTAGAARRLTQVAIYNEELARAGAPPLLGRAGITLVGPTLDGARHRRATRAVDAADPRRRRRVVPAVQRAGRGERPRRRCRRAPTKSGGVYRVTGQKVWSSYATFADMGIALVRTDPDAPPHKGISMLAIPMDATGVDVRPLRQMTGELRVQRGVPRRRRGAGRPSHRSRERGLARREHDARQRARRVVHLAGAGARTRSRSTALIAGVHAPRRHRRRACAPAARAVVDRRRALPPAQRAHARPARARRGDRRGVEPREAVLGGHEPAARRDRDRVLGPGRCSCRRPDAGRGGGAAADDARQLDHGRHERDPTQHHRRAHPRPAAGAER